MVAFDLLPRSFNQFVVADSRRARCDAGKATQTGIEMLHSCGGKGNFALVYPVHQVNAPSGRICFLANHPIAGASRQTKAAMDASINQRWVGWMIGIESRLAAIGSWKLGVWGLSV